MPREKITAFRSICSNEILILIEAYKFVICYITWKFGAIWPILHCVTGISGLLPSTTRDVDWWQTTDLVLFLVWIVGAIWEEFDSTMEKYKMKQVMTTIWKVGCLYDF